MVMNDYDKLTIDGEQIVKISKGNEQLWHETNVRNMSGTSPVTVTGNRNRQMPKFELYGKSEQSGTPSPDYPQPIVNNDAKWAVHGKNLFDPSVYLPENKSVYERYGNGFKITGTDPSSYNLVQGKYFPFELNVDYSTSFDYTVDGTVSGRIYGMFGNNWYPQSNTSGRHVIYHKKTTDVKDKENFNLRFRTPYAGDSLVLDGTITISNIQIELGSTATSYEPYHNGGTVDLSNIKLRGVGTYKDTYDAVTGVVTRNTGHIESYNGETITTPYISTTGGLDTGAEVVYGLETPTTEQAIAQPPTQHIGTNIAEWQSGSVNEKTVSLQYWQDENRERLKKQYGFRWAGTSLTDGTRLGDAVGMVANAHLGTNAPVRNDFDSAYPWCDMKLCNIANDGTVNAYIGDPSFKKDGTNGDVMVEIPKFYYKRVKTGTQEEWWISGECYSGYRLHSLFEDDGVEMSKAYVGAYDMDTENVNGTTHGRSRSGVQARVSTTRANFRNYARANGSHWSIEDMSCISAIQMLFLIEYASTHSQQKLGNGACSLQYSANHKAVVAETATNRIIIDYAYRTAFKLGQRIEIGTSQGGGLLTSTPRTIINIESDSTENTTTITFDGSPINIAVGNLLWNVNPLNGQCDDLDGGSGWLAGEYEYTNGYANTNYRGIEGVHGAIFRFIDGININDHQAYIANSSADYADDVWTGKYTPVSYTHPTANGYPTAMGCDNDRPWIMTPETVGGGSSTYYPDYYYQNTGKRLCILGGFWSNGSYDGLFYFGCDGACTSTSLYIGARLLYKKP